MRRLSSIRVPIFHMCGLNSLWLLFCDVNGLSRSPHMFFYHNDDVELYKLDVYLAWRVCPSFEG